MIPEIIEGQKGSLLSLVILDRPDPIFKGAYRYLKMGRLRQTSHLHEVVA